MGYTVVSKKKPAMVKVVTRTKSKVKKHVEFNPLMKKAIKKIAKNVVNKTLEDKYVCDVGSATFNSPITSGHEIFSLIPRCSIPASGSSNSSLIFERTGVEIEPKSIVTDFHFGLTDVSRSMNVKVHLYLLQYKSYKYFGNTADPTSASGVWHAGSINILKGGNFDSGAAGPFTGLITDGDLPVNDNTFTLLKKYTFQLCKNTGDVQDSTDAGNQPTVSGGMSYKHIKYVYKMSKKLKYNTVGNVDTLYPDGHAPFWCVGYSHINNSEIDNVNQDVYCQWTTKMHFSDA